MEKRNAWFFLYFLTITALLLIVNCLSKVTTVIAEYSPMRREHCIIIDPGHGGEDGGATSCTGILESRYNLEISQRLNDLLHFLGYDTQMIRTSDISVYTRGETIAQKKVSDLKERVRIVNETENALLLSIHQNTFSDSRYRGAQVFYACTQGSEELAKKMQAAFNMVLNPERQRMSKKSEGIYLMDHIKTTGVLIECGFLSNPQEEALLRNPVYQKIICCIIAASVSDFLSNT